MIVDISNNTVCHIQLKPIPGDRVRKLLLHDMGMYWLVIKSNSTVMMSDYIYGNQSFKSTGLAQT